METRRAQMFPVLTEAQVTRIRRFGQELRFSAGTLVFEEGDYGVPFFVVLEGEVAIVHPRDLVEEPITVHGPHQFTGEMTSLTGRRALVRGRAKTDARLLRLEAPQLQSIVQTDPELSEIFMRAFILRRMGLFIGHQGDAIILGSRHSAATLRIQEFLTRNGHPHRYLDVDSDPEVQALFERFQVGIGDVPVVVCRSERVLKNPSNAEVAECLGFNPQIDGCAIHDVVVVGAGPAGLAAAVYAASEGLDVLVVEQTAPGGQAGASSKIENYLGFPTGISGQALAHRALTQAEKFGAKILIARGAAKLNCEILPYRVILDSGDVVRARAVVIATGAEYRKLELPDLPRFEGIGVYYAATFVEAQLCESEEVVIVGGGNSAGQAATFMAQNSRHVHVVIRGRSLASSMSRYLIRRIEDTPNITLHANTHITNLSGTDRLEEVTWVESTTGKRTCLPIRHIFSMTGAKPNTEWLAGCLKTDEKGFVLTGVDLPKGEQVVGAPRLPYLFETSLRNVFAVGDVRANSIKRVAAGVGEGSTCIALIHRALAE
jgi:thioredoxin reductase (NADPH)